MSRHSSGWMRDYLAKRKARGICPSCGKPYDGPRFYCLACRVKRAAMARTKRAA